MIGSASGQGEEDYEAALEEGEEGQPESRPERPRGQSREISGDGEQWVGDDSQWDKNVFFIRSLSSTGIGIFAWNVIVQEMSFLYHAWPLIAFENKIPAVIADKGPLSTWSF